MGEWREVRLGDLAEFLNGDRGKNYPSGAAFVPSGVPFVNAGHLLNGRIDWSAMDYISTDRAALLRGGRFKPGDVLYCLRGTLGKHARVNEGAPVGTVASSLVIIRANPGVCDERFLYLVLGSPAGQTLAKRLDNGSVQPNISVSALAELSVPLPPLPEQRAIAHILGTLDDKIELNRRTSETLEAMARALFKSWFVDFDPVRAKARGEKPAGMDEATAKLFPSELVDSELGPVPKGWRVARLEELVELAYGKALPKSTRFSGHVPVYGSGGKDGTHSVALVSGPGIIIGRKGTVGSVYWSPCDFFPIDTTFYVRLLDNSVTMRWAHEAVRSIDIAALGADSAVPGVNRHALGRRSLLVPPPGLLSAYERSADPFWARADALEGQAITLERTRDALLPKLLSGELSVREVA